MNVLDLNNTTVEGFRLEQRGERMVSVVTVEYGVPQPSMFGIKTLQRHGYRWRTVPDTPLHGRPCFLEVRIPRLRDVDTGEEKTPDVHWIHPRWRMTRRLREHICERAQRDSFAAIAADTGVSPSRVGDIVREFAAEAERLFEPRAPRFLGIDEAHIAGRKRAVLTDVDQRHVVDVLETHGRQAVYQAVHGLAERERIEAVTIDLYTPYLQAAQAALPGVPVVADKRHVTELARAPMEKERKRLRRSMTKRQARELMDDARLLNKRWHELTAMEQMRVEGWCANYPALGEAYRLKEEFFRIYQHAARADAEAAFDGWRAQIGDDTPAGFQRVADTVQRWREQVFAYFDVGITNGYTESANRLLKDRYRRSRGYGGDFSMFRGLVLAQHGVRSYRRHAGAKRWHLLTNKGACPLGYEDETEWFEAAERLLRGVFDPANMGEDDAA